MPRGKKSKITASGEDAVATVECLDCKHKYENIKEAMSYHNDESILTHRIKPIKVNKQLSEVRKVEQTEDDSTVSEGIPIKGYTYADQLEELARKYPTLINPEARELTRGMEGIKQADIVMKAKRSQAQIILKEIPNYEQASKLSDATLSEYVSHSGNCNGNCKVSRSSNTITVSCSVCNSKTTVTKKA